MGTLPRRRRLVLAAATVALVSMGAAWRLRMAETPVHEVHARATARLPVSLPLTSPRIVIAKSARTLTLLDGDRAIRRYRIGLGSNPLTDKEREGDGCTPEGNFYVCGRNSRSRFHLSLHISYPDPGDAARGVAAGLISLADAEAIRTAHAHRCVPPQRTALGGELFIHGGGGHRDWTRGCVAVGDDEIEELFAAVPDGAPVTITR